MSENKPVPWSLDETMERIASISAKWAGEHEQGLAELYCLDDDNALTICGMSVGGGDMIAWAARSLVFQLEPVQAVLGVEGWIPRRGLPETDPDFRRATMGEMAISDMPREKRGEMLILYGETASGDKQYQMWHLKSSGPPDFQRTGIEREPPPDGDVKMTSRFEPLFILEHTLRILESTSPDDPRYALLQQFGWPDTPAKRRKAVRLAVGAVLAEGLGMTTATWEEWMERAHRENIRRIVKEGGPAAE